MKRLILLLILFVPLQLSAELQIPSLKAPVMDAAGALNPAEEQEVNSVLRWLESTGKVQMAVYFPKSLQGYDIESFSIEVAEKWKLGQRGVDNGLLMIVAMNERKARLEVGYGLEGDIPDAYAKRILDDVLIPFLREGNLKDGVIASIAQVTVYLDIPLPEDGAVRVQVPEPQGGGGGGLFCLSRFGPGFYHGLQGAPLVTGIAFYSCNEIGNQVCPAGVLIVHLSCS